MDHGRLGVGAQPLAVGCAGCRGLQAIASAIAHWSGTRSKGSLAAAPPVVQGRVPLAVPHCRGGGPARAAAAAVPAAFHWQFLTKFFQIQVSTREPPVATEQSTFPDSPKSFSFACFAAVSDELSLSVRMFQKCIRLPF